MGLLITASKPDTAGHPRGGALPARRIALRTRGSQQGAITRLMSPSDVGRVVKPFVFLDHFDDDTTPPGMFPLHPHSGIATLTYMVDGEIEYADTTGARGLLPTGGVEWMMAGGGVWHTGGPTPLRRMAGFQLWVALPAELENAPAQSMYLHPKDLPHVGPARVLLGSHGGASSPIPSPSPMNYLGVRLAAGESWRYEPPRGHSVAWLAVHSGRLSAQEPIPAGEMVVFEESNQAIDLHARTDTVFVLGSAAKHPHDLVLGYYSVHTSAQALEQGEAGIRKIAERVSEGERRSRLAQLRPGRKA